MDRMRALEVFIEVADCGSLAGAARKLSISPPSVTRLLNDLEQDLGVLLFHRTTRAVTLSEPGRTFLADARKILQGYQEATDSARGAHRAPKGVLRLTASTLFGQHYISTLLLEYLDRFPDVHVDAVYLDRVVNVVEEGFDVAVRIGPLADSSLMATKVGEVRRVICGSAAYLEREGTPRTPGDLTRHNMITVRAISPSDDWRFAGGETVKVSPRLYYSSVMPAIGAARAGWGLTRVLSYQIGPDLGAGDLETVLNEFEPEPLPIHIVHAEGRIASAKVRAFVDLARDRLRANAYLNP